MDLASKSEAANLANASRPFRERQLDLRPAATAFHALIQGWEDRAELCPSARLLVRHMLRAELPEALRGDAQALPFVDELDAQAVGGRRAAAGGGAGAGPADQD